MKHILFIDPLEKLSPKKDSTLLMALTLKSLGKEVYLLFEKDFYIVNTDELKYQVYKFEGEILENFYIENFKVTDSLEINFDSTTTVHMRIDPPYDSRYQRYLWMLDFLQNRGVSITNNPRLTGEVLVGLEVTMRKLPCVRIPPGLELLLKLTF